MLQRDVKLFARCLISAVVMLIVLAAACAAAVMIYSGSGNKLYTPVKVALVDNEGSTVSRILVHAVGESDFIEGLLEFEKMDEDEAVSAIRDGSISAAVILPEGYIDDIIHGHEACGRIIISSKLSAQRGIIESIAKMGETLLVSGQNGVFCGEGLLNEYGYGWDVKSPYYDRVNVGLLREAMEANERYFVVEELDYCDTGVSETSYLVISWLSAILLLISIFFIPLFEKDCSQPLLQRLYVAGVGNARFLAFKLALTFGFRALIAVAAVIVSARLGITDVTAAGILFAVASSAFTTIVGACLAASFGNGIANCFIFAVGGLVMCGGIVPRQLLPDAVTAVGDLSPFGVAKALLAPAFGGSLDAAAVAMAILYTIAAAALLVIKLNRVRAGGEAYEA